MHGDPGPHKAGFTHAEIAVLSRAGILDGLCRVSDQSISLNEHASHALADFCRETYEAWGRCQERLSAARTALANTKDDDNARD